MILQELCELYDRLSHDSSASASIAPQGWSREKVSWALVIDESGHVLTLYQLLQGDQEGQKLIVPRPMEERTSNEKAYFLCDKAEYLLGVGGPRGARRRALSAALHSEVLGDSTDAGAHAVRAFFGQASATEGLPADVVQQVALNGQMALCLNQPGQFIHEREAIKIAWDRFYLQELLGKEKVGWCSVTGRQGRLTQLYPKAHGVPGTDKSVVLVTYNFQAAESYGKEKTQNASLSAEAAFKSGTALKYLLSNSDHLVRMGSTIITFWTDAPAPVADGFLRMLAGGQKAEDEVTRQGVSQALKEMRRGRELTTVDPGIGYHLLGLSPNAARLSVRFFESGTFGQLAERYGQYLRDTEMVGVDGLSFWPMMAQTATLGKLENIPSTLVTRCFSAMVNGEEFPCAMEELVRSRMRADHGKVPYKGKTRDLMGSRAAVLKAYRVRYQRANGIRESEKERVEVALNRQNENIGYLLGRLFAVLEYAQQKAVPGANATIRDRYIGSASTTPERVFQPLLRGCQAHLGKLRKDSSTVWIATKVERELEQIVGMQLPDSGIPKVLGADDQDMFFIGYYQERCDLCPSKADRAAAEDAASDDDDTKED